MKYFFLSCVFLLFFNACENSKPSKVHPSSQVLFRNLGNTPSTLNPIRSTDVIASTVQNHVIESLLWRNIDTYKWEPHLATKWVVGKDQKTFTFTLREGVKWHDGKALTVEDVAFSFKVVKDPSFGGVHLLPYYEGIDSVTILNKKQVQFKASKTYFNNLSILAGMQIIPKHIYKDKTKKLSRILIGSGPYILKKYDRGKHIILVQNPHWWGRVVKSDFFRIKQITFKFIPDDNDELLRMSAGNLDFISLSAEDYIKKTNKKPWGETIIKKEIKNKSPSGYGFIAWNLTKPLFQDKKVRKALAYLMNRPLLNKKFRYSKSILATGPWYAWSDYADPSVKPILFNPKKARQLLKQAGWSDTDKNGVLDKMIKGKKQEFRFTLVEPNKDMEKYLTIYQQDLKDNGISMSIRFMEWSAFLKILHDKKFSAVHLGWSGSVEIDPKQIWHSESARKGGSNFISYSNPKVDALINKGRQTLNRQKRIKIFQKVYRLIAEDYPYLFLFNGPIQFYAYSKKIKMLKDTYRYGLGEEYWYLSP